MASYLKTPLSTWIRGAQTTIHEYQMMWQSLWQTVLATIVIIFGFAFWETWVETTEFERYKIYKWTEASFKLSFGGKPQPVKFEAEDGTVYFFDPLKYAKSDIATEALNKAMNAAMKGGIVGLSIGSIIIVLVLGFFYLQGKQQSEDFHVRGAKVGTPKDLITALEKRGKKGVISLGGIRLTHDLEPKSIALIGAPRTGKSFQITQVLQEIRAAKKRVILFDYGANFTELFYREGVDIILNPADERSAEWRPWYDNLEPAHFEQQAASLIPDTKGGDEFWTKAARSVYVAITRKLSTMYSNPSLEDLLYWGLQAQPENVISFLKGTEAAASLGKDKTAASIMSHLATYLKTFNYLRTEGTPFSIREWVENEENDGWLIISTRADQMDAVRPLISMWVDIATSAILSMRPDRERRLWYIFDELPTLHVLPSLITTLTNAPKFGGCGILGYQSHTLLQQRWGEDGANAITGACAVHCIFRAQDNPTAKWAEEDIGEAEVAQTNEGISYGVNTIRDGKTTNVNRTTTKIVLASEIKNLADLQFFLNIGSGLPVVPLQLRYKSYPTIAEAFIPRQSDKLVISASYEPDHLCDYQQEEPPTDEHMGQDMGSIPTQSGFDFETSEACDVRPNNFAETLLRGQNKNPEGKTSLLSEMEKAEAREKEFLANLRSKPVSHTNSQSSE